MRRPRESFWFDKTLFSIRLVCTTSTNLPFHFAALATIRVAPDRAAPCRAATLIIS